MDCPFCKIVAGTIPSKQVYEDELTYASGIQWEVFFDQSSHLIVAEKAHAAGIPQEIDYDDYRAENGVQVPHKLEMEHLIPVETLIDSGVARLALPEHEWRHREGFKLTDPGMDLNAALDQANYCIKCHNQEKDSCSTGLKEKTGEFKKSPFGVTLAGCPLEEKISEMNLTAAGGLLRSGHSPVTIVP